MYYVVLFPPRFITRSNIKRRAPVFPLEQCWQIAVGNFEKRRKLGMGASNTQVNAGDTDRLLIAKGSCHFKRLGKYENKYFGNAYV